MTALEGIRCIDDIELQNRRVLIRVDFDVPASPTDEILSDARIRASLRTIRHALAAEARVILAARWRPPPHRNRREPGSLEPVAQVLSGLLETEVYLPDDCVSDAAKKVITDLRPGQLCLLENLSFYDKEEDAQDGSFAQALARLIDVYVNDDLGSCVVPGASTTVVPSLLNERGVGFLLRDELLGLSQDLLAAEQPLGAILGGTDLSRAIRLMTYLLPRCQFIGLVGIPGNTFLAAKGMRLNEVSYQPDRLARCRALIESAKDHRVELLTPTDLLIRDSHQLDQSKLITLADVSASPPEVLDIGPATVQCLQKLSQGAKTILWDGLPSANSSRSLPGAALDIASALADGGSRTLVSGRDTVEWLDAQENGNCSQFDFLSSGGDALLSLLEGRRLPGLDALRSNRPTLH